MRNASIAVLREIGSIRRLQRAVPVNPATAAWSHRDEPAGVALLALASKATGFPIAKVAASWPSLHPRRAGQRHHARDAGLLRDRPSTTRHEDAALHLRKFPGAEATLTTSMKSVGRPCPSAVLRGVRPEALRSMETGSPVSTKWTSRGGRSNTLRAALAKPTPIAC